MKMDGSVLEGKSSFKMLRLTFSFKFDWGSYIISIAKTASKEIGALIRSMKILSPEVALYLYKSTIWPGMECCCHVWAGAPSCYLELLEKLQKRIWRTVRPSLPAYLEPLVHRWNVASLILYCKYYFGRCSFRLAELVLLPYSRGMSAVILIDSLFMIFLSPFLYVARKSISIVSFLAQLDSGIICL